VLLVAITRHLLDRYLGRCFLLCVPLPLCLLYLPRSAAAGCLVLLHVLLQQPERLCALLAQAAHLSARGKLLGPSLLCQPPLLRQLFPGSLFPLQRRRPLLQQGSPQTPDLLRPGRLRLPVRLFQGGHESLQLLGACLLRRPGVCLQLLHELSSSGQLPLCLRENKRDLLLLTLRDKDLLLLVRNNSRVLIDQALAIRARVLLLLPRLADSILPLLLSRGRCCLRLRDQALQLCSFSLALCFRLRRHALESGQHCPVLLVAITRHLLDRYLGRCFLLCVPLPLCCNLYLPRSAGCLYLLL